MRTVSAFYNPYPDAIWSDFRVSYKLIDLTAAEDTTPSSNQQNAHMTQLAQLVDGIRSMAAKWAVLETGGWPMDGSAALVPDDMSGYQSGWWSGISDANGEFAVAPALTFPFSTNHTSIGFSIFFDDKAGRYPKSVTVTAYDAADAVLATKTVTPTGPLCVVDMPVENYRKVVVAFGDTQEAYQSIRVCEVVFGVIRRLDKSNTTESRLLEAISPIAESLPSKELSITLDNLEQDYNLSNPTGINAYIQEGQMLEIEIAVGDSRNTLEYVSGGKLYFTSVSAKDASLTAQMTANDPFLRLDDSTCNIGETGTWTLADGVAAVITDSGRDVTVDIPAGLASRTIRKCIPQGTSHREALRLIAQAARCTCWFSRDDVLVFREIAVSTPVEELGADNMPEHAQAETAKRVNTVELVVRDEYAGTETIYTDTNAGANEPIQSQKFTNPLVNDGAAVAAWLLAQKAYRLSYALVELGNPAREIGDTVTVNDAYGTEADAVIIQQEHHFSIDGLSALSRAWRCG